MLSSIPCTAEAYLTTENRNVTGSAVADGSFTAVKLTVPRGFPAADMENYTAPSDLVFDPGAMSPGTTNLSSLTEARKKLSTDLLQLTDDNFLPPGMTREALIGQMESLNQITRVDEQAVHANDLFVYSDNYNASVNDMYIEGNVDCGSDDCVPVDSEYVGYEPVDSESVGCEPVDSGSDDCVPVDSESAGCEPVDSEPAEDETDSRLQGADLVHVYVRFYPGNGTDCADPYVEKVTGRDEENHLMAAWVRVDSFEQLASLESVQCVRTVMPPVIRTGMYTTEGDAILNCDEVRALHGLTGEGIRIGIISNGVDNLADAVATGDLPANVTVLSNSEGGDEGTAMLEIVHDIAPGAELYFHDSGNNVIAFNNAVDSLAGAGCDIICDDIGWIFEPFFEDGVVASHVQGVVESNDTLYVSAAGNDALTHYQGEFAPVGTNFHDFSGGTGETEWLYGFVPPGGSIIVVFQWNDEWGKSENDYDLYLGDMINGRIISWSTDMQDGNDLPIEALTYLNTEQTGKNVAVLVRKVTGDPGVLEVFVYPFSGAFLYANNLVAEDSVYGHPAVPGVVSVGAINAADPGNDNIQRSSSRGPVSIYHSSFELREKPDIAGIDGVQVSGAGGFPPVFFGTSAAAPHIAGLAGLVWSGFPEKPGSEIRAALLESSVDLGEPGKDGSFGYGRADALAMYEFLLPAVPLPVANFTVNRTGGLAPLTVQFTSLSENASSLSWDVNGDNITDYTDQNPVHTYTEPGLYTVTLIANNSAGSDTLTKPDLVNIMKPRPVKTGTRGMILTLPGEPSLR
ncbi:S8 family serine peptidase [Methanosarcina sp. Mfa9]|uniref:S8 family serine peptidase n=1 Tax=Methanosarcina sp. Mfa9 TaxID=3439063 RepID=UPI003F86472A